MARILILDDEKQYGEFLKHLVESEGYQVEVTSNSLEGIVTALTFRPDVLIVDWLLKHHFDGLDVSKMLQQLNPQLKVILITGQPRPILEVKQRFVNISRIMLKPLNIKEMLSAVAHALETDSEASSNPADRPQHRLTPSPNRFPPLSS